MQNPNRFFAVPIIGIFVCTAFLFSGLNTPSQDKNKTKPLQAEEVDTSRIPVVDFLDVSPEELAKQRGKGRKYDNKYSPPIDEDRDISVTTTDWERGLPAFPLQKSVAVIIGTVVKAKAHFSERKTDVFSEFEVEIEEVLKNDGKFTVGSSAFVERAGGRVRFPSGKMMVSIISKQQMPVVGKQYLLFLTHDGPLGGIYEDYFILTGYEFRGDIVFPLDQSVPGHPISAYRGVDKDSFFTDLNSALNVVGLATR